jgi:hypothetical protein
MKFSVFFEIVVLVLNTEVLAISKCDLSAKNLIDIVCDQIKHDNESLYPFTTISYAQTIDGSM